MKTRAIGKTEAVIKKGVTYFGHFSELKVQVLHLDTDRASTTIQTIISSF
jgi:hypothetical protein